MQCQKELQKERIYLNDKKNGKWGLHSKYLELKLNIYQTKDREDILTDNNRHGYVADIKHYYCSKGNWNFV